MSEVASIVQGRLRTPDALGTGLVRVFISSTFTDTDHERNAILQDAVPRIQAFARALDYQFAVSEMRWGVTQSAANNHEHAELCLNEIRNCQAESEGIFFVSLLAQKYGFRPFPPRIPADEFETLSAQVTAEDDKALLAKWFELDSNAVPAVQGLLPIPRLIPGYGDQSPAGAKAGAEWWEAFSALQRILSDAAKAAELPEERRRDYIISITEQETRLGLEIADVNKRAIWFRRTMEGLDSNLTDPAARLYTDIKNGGRDTEAAQLLAALEDEYVPSTGLTNITPYTLKEWAPEAGIGEGITEHKEYLAELCSSFVDAMQASIKDAAARSKELRADAVYVEAAKHAAMCRERCETFRGRRGVLSQIEAVIDKTETDGCVHAVHGKSGSGKTSVMAMCAMYASEKHTNATIMLRFLGTTGESSSISRLLKSLCQQLYRVYAPEKEASVGDAYDDLVTEFAECLGLATAEKPIFLFLDSLDQLSPQQGGRKLRWLPKTELPPHAHVIVSTLPEEKYDCLPALKLRLSDDHFIGVPALSLEDGPLIIQETLERAGRTVTEEQHSILFKAFEQNPTPLYLKLAIDEAVKWQSATPTAGLALAPSVRGLIDHLFSTLEHLYGELFVSHALGYITAARRGLSTSELDDVLSLDDAVLDSVFEYWIPPLRRIPPSLFARVRHDLGGFLVERGEGGVRVLQWHHRQFWEAAEDRYLHGTNLERSHSLLAEYFLGLWATTPKPYSNSAAKMDRFKLTAAEDKALRYVAEQPSTFADDKPNLRRLDELAYHLSKGSSGLRTEHLGQACLLNYDFLLLKYRHFGRVEVLNDFQEALGATADARFHAVMSAIRLCPEKDAEQLAGNLVGRLSLVNSSGSFTGLLDGCKTSTLNKFPVLMPPTGCLSPLTNSVKIAHPDKLHDVAVSPDGRYMGVIGEDRKAYIYDVESSDQIVILGDFDWIGAGLAFSPDSTKLACVSRSTDIHVYEVESWENLGERLLQGYAEAVQFVNNDTLIVGCDSGLVVVPLADLSVVVNEDEETPAPDPIGGNDIKDVCLSKHFIAASSEGGALILDRASLAIVHTIDDGLHDYGAKCCISNSEKFVAFGSAQSTKVFRLDGGQCVMHRRTSGYSGGLVAFSHDDRLLIMVEKSAVVVYSGWETDNLVEVKRFAVGSDSANTARVVGTKVYLSSADRNLRVFDLEAEQVTVDLPTLDGFSFPKDGCVVVGGDLGMASHSGNEIVMNMITGEVFEDRDATASKAIATSRLLGEKPFDTTPTSVTSTATGKTQDFTQRHRKTPIHNEASRDGKSVIVTSKDGAGFLVDVEADTHIILQHMAADSANFNRLLTAACFAGKDEQYCLTGGQDLQVKMWRRDTGELLHTMVFDNGINWLGAFGNHVLVLQKNGGVAVLHILEGPVDLTKKPTRPLNEGIVVPERPTSRAVGSGGGGGGSGGCCSVQ